MLKGLLDELVKVVGCAYMSDLHKVTKISDRKRFLDKISKDYYDLKEWRDAVGYLTGNYQLEIMTEEDARNYLCSKFVFNDESEK